MFFLHSIVWLRMSMFLKLFVAFGLTWAFEVVAWLNSAEDVSVPLSLQIILNIANVLQGVIIFLVFGLKRTGSKPTRSGTYRYSRSASTSSTAASSKVISLRGSSRVSTNPAGRSYRRSVSADFSE